MEKKTLALLKSEIGIQQEEIERIYVRLRERGTGKGRWRVEAIAYQLHNLYCAFEDLFKAIAATFENHIEDKAKYHSELLKRMTIAVSGVRPSLLSHDSFLLLESLRSFRHFFRHAYAYELDERKVRLVYEDAIRLQKVYKKDIKKFLGAL